MTKTSFLHGAIICSVVLMYGSAFFIQSEIIPHSFAAEQCVDHYDVGYCTTAGTPLNAGEHVPEYDINCPEGKIFIKTGEEPGDCEDIYLHESAEQLTQTETCTINVSSQPLVVEGTFTFGFTYTDVYDDIQLAQQFVPTQGYGWSGNGSIKAKDFTSPITVLFDNTGTYAISFHLYNAGALVATCSETYPVIAKEIKNERLPTHQSPVRPRPVKTDDIINSFKYLLCMRNIGDEDICRELITGKEKDEEVNFAGTTRQVEDECTIRDTSTNTACLTCDTGIPGGLSHISAGLGYYTHAIKGDAYLCSSEQEGSISFTLPQKPELINEQDDGAYIAIGLAPVGDIGETDYRKPFAQQHIRFLYSNYEHILIWEDHHLCVEYSNKQYDFDNYCPKDPNDRIQNQLIQDGFQGARPGDRVEIRFGSYGMRVFLNGIELRNNYQKDNYPLPIEQPYPTTLQVTFSGLEGLCAICMDIQGFKTSCDDSGTIISTPPQDCTRTSYTDFTKEKEMEEEGGETDPPGGGNCNSYSPDGNCIF